MAIISAIRVTVVSCPRPDYQTDDHQLNIYTRNWLWISRLTVSYRHKVYYVQSAAPPLADISIIRVHIALVLAQLVMPEHWSFSRAGLIFRNKVKFYCRHSAFKYTADPTYRYCSGTTLAMWTGPYLIDIIRTSVNIHSRASNYDACFLFLLRFCHDVL